MNKEIIDGSAGDVDYGHVGHTYSKHRQPEPLIEEFIKQALGDAKTVLNVGAGAGSYEPRDRKVTAVEPSSSMRSQRPSYLSRAIGAIAENLPFEDNEFDASMTTFSVHQWNDLQAGLSEMRRVTKGPVIVLSCAPEEVEEFWLNDYAPEVLITEARRYPSINRISKFIGNRLDVQTVPIPLNCRDGFNEAYYGRPEKFLEEGTKLACSAWSFVDGAYKSNFENRLSNDLNNGSWDEKLGYLRAQERYEGSLKLIIATP